MLEVWKARSVLEGLSEQTGPDQQRRLTRKGHDKNATDAHNFDSTQPANNEPEVEVGGFGMSHFNVDTVEVQESEWIKIGVDTGAGQTAWPPQGHILETDTW